jgi:hypothetical protein
MIGLLWACMSQPALSTVCGPYMGQDPPGFRPAIFAPGFISREDRLDEYITFSPDGNECYFGTNNANWSLSKLYETHMENGTWTEPIRATATQGWGFNAIFPPTDAQSLYFVDGRAPMPQNLDIFRVDRNHGQWGEAIRLPAPINSSATDWHPSFTTDGTMYFGSTRIEGAVYRVRPFDGDDPVVEKISIPCRAYSPAIAYDESFMIFRRDEAVGYGNGDGFISLRNEDDTWTPARNLGPLINTSEFEYGFSLSPDGQYLFFTRRDRGIGPTRSDIYWVNIGAVVPDPNGPIENLSSGLRFASLNAAIIFVESGDSLVLPPGIYTENIVLDKDIILCSNDPNDPFYIGGTIIQGDPNEPVVTLSNNTKACTIAGLTLRAGSVGITGTATNATLRNCRIMDNVMHGVELFEGSNPHFNHCLITANDQTGITMHEWGGRRTIYCEPVIKDCVIVQNGDANIIGGQSVIIDSIITGNSD